MLTVDRTSKFLYKDVKGNLYAYYKRSLHADEFDEGKNKKNLFAYNICVFRNTQIVLPGNSHVTPSFYKHPVFF